MPNRLTVTAVPLGRRRLGLLALALAGLIAAAPLGAAEVAETPVGLDGQSGLTVTIYNRDLALISEKRRVDFAAGENRLALQDVSARLWPETVRLEGDGLALVEQSFQADLVVPSRLMERALGKTVWVRRVNPADGSVGYAEGELVSVAEGPMVLLDGRLESVPLADLAFGTETEGLRDRPTLVAVLLSEEAGPRDLGLRYLTGGLSWQADYVAELNAAEDRLDLTGLVTLGNRSGTVYRDARLRLVAGDVNQEAPMAMMARAESDALAAMPAAPPKMNELPVGDQHLYELDRPVTLGRRETKQVTLLAAASLPVTKEYRFEELISAYGGAEEIGPVKAAVILEFANEASEGLGRPLPRGIMRVYQATGDGPDAVFVGEDGIDHTSEGERVRLTTGRAFDVTGRARRTVFERISNKTYDTGQDIEVKNAKDRAVSVTLVGHMPRGWRLLEESRPHERETANRLAWTFEVPAGGTASLSYKVRVTQP